MHRLNALLLLPLCSILVLAGCGDIESGDSNYYYDGYSQDTSSTSDSSTSWDQSTSDSYQDTSHNTNVNLGGAQDFGYFRRLLAEGIVPSPDNLDAAGFFAEHHTPLPTPDCGNVVCLQSMLGSASSLISDQQATILQVGLNSPLAADESQRPPLQLAIVVDVSGSMQSAGKMEFVRQGLTRLINEMRDGDAITLISYSSSAQLKFEMAEVSLARNELLDIIAGLQAGGGTNLYAGLEMGYQELLKAYDSGRQNRLILLSDGVATEGNTDSDAILAMSKAYNSDGLGLTSIGLGTDFNYELMRTLSEQADGNFYFLEDSSAVEEVFTQEISYFTVPVAFDVEIELQEGTDFTVIGSHGSRLWQESDQGGRIEIPSVFLAHREADSDVEPGDERRGGGSALIFELQPRTNDGTSPSESAVATVSLQFREPGTNAIVQQEINVTYPMAPWMAPATGYFEHEIITKNFVILNIFLAMQRACALHYENRGEEAIILLRLVMAAAQDFEATANDGEGDLDIQLDVELMQELIDVIIANGYEEPDNIEYPDDPWPCN